MFTGAGGTSIRISSRGTINRSCRHTSRDSSPDRSSRPGSRRRAATMDRSITPLSSITIEGHARCYTYLLTPSRRTWNPCFCVLRVFAEFIDGSNVAVERTARGASETFFRLRSLVAYSMLLYLEIDRPPASGKRSYLFIVFPFFDKVSSCFLPKITWPMRIEESVRFGSRVSSYISHVYHLAIDVLSFFVNEGIFPNRYSIALCR